MPSMDLDLGSVGDDLSLQNLYNVLQCQFAEVRLPSAKAKRVIDIQMGDSEETMGLNVEMGFHGLEMRLRFQACCFAYRASVDSRAQPPSKPGNSRLKSRRTLVVGSSILSVMEY